MRSAVVPCIAAILLMGCSDGHPMIRITNDSSVTMENVLVKFPGQAERYGDIPPNVSTEYRKVDRAYRYAYIEVVVKGEKAVIQPKDFVGEQLLDPGRYSYILSYDSKSGSKFSRLRLKLAED